MMMMMMMMMTTIEFVQNFLQLTPTEISMMITTVELVNNLRLTPIALFENYNINDDGDDE